MRTKIAFLRLINRGGLHLIETEYSSITRLIEVCHKVEDLPMDLADATLIVASEKLNIKEIATIDSDFCI